MVIGKLIKRLVKMMVLGSLGSVLACQDSGTKRVLPPGHTTPPPASTPTPAPKKPVWSGNLNVSNVNKYYDLLRQQRRCETSSWKNWGDSSCKRFGAIAKMTVAFEKEELPSRATLTITPIFSGSVGGYLNLGLHGYSHPNPTSPLVYKGTAKYVNDYDGFYIRFDRVEDVFGSPGLGYVILKSEYGIPADNANLEVTLYYGGSDSDKNKVGTTNLDHPNAEHTSISYSR